MRKNSIQKVLSPILTELQHLKKVLRKKAFSRAGTDEDRKSSIPVWKQLVSLE